MNNSKLATREELCRNLNMNFDEASQLFSDETLESMQMAKVNGGAPVAPIIWKVIEIIVVAGVSYFVGRCENGPTEVKEITNDQYKILDKWMTISADSTFVYFDKNGLITEMKIYNPNNNQPTPTPTSGLK